MTWWNRPGLKDYDAIICDGAVRSGKTVCMADGFFLWSMLNFDKQSFGLCGRSVSSLRRNVTANLNSWLGGLMRIKESRGDNKLTVRYKGKENTYYLFGGLDESSYKQIQGVTLAGAFLDEVALMPRTFVEQTCARCSIAGSKLWFNCNPAGPEHWFYKEWILGAKKKRALHLHFTMEDNPGLDPRIRLRYEQMYSGVFYRRYVLGQWCLAEGLVYDFDPVRHIATQLPKTGRYYISVDYGTRNPFSAGLWCVTGGKAYRMREFYHDGRTAGKMYTDEEYYRFLEQLAEGYPVEQVVIDPSAASFIAVIRRHGRFSVRKAKNAVLDGIRLVSTLLHANVLQFAPGCKDTLREFSLYTWQEEGDKPLKENDHAMDDIRYFCATVLSREKYILERLGQNEEMAH
jgi:PBSX family phage terminase large subunit